MRAALLLIAIAGMLGAIAAAFITREMWAVLTTLFSIGAAIIVGRLAWVHRVPGIPRKIRKLGPLPPDPGMRPKPDVTKDPFRG